MPRRHLFLVALCVSAPVFAAGPQSKAVPRDLYLGEAYYQAAQGNYFDAISRLDTELAQFYRLDDPTRDPLHFRVNRANFSVGDFELSYRMHQRASRAVKAVLEGKVDEAVRNEATWRLARIYMQMDDVRSALSTIDKIHGRIPDKVRDDEQFLRARIYMASGMFPEAIRILQNLRNVKKLEGFATYNLGVALLLDGQKAEGLEVLDKTGLLKSDDEAALAVRDKANLLLGNRMLSANEPARAKQYFDRVRLSGPFSNLALLSSGWADAALGKFDRSLVPWSILVKRNVTDKAVQEGMLGLPYAYGKLELYGRAATLYGSALEHFGKELAKLDASLKSIREGRFLKALVRDELKQDRNWVVKLRKLPGTPETYYLLELMASDDFQESLRNYQDLEDLRRRLSAWKDSLDSFEEIIAIRKQYYDGVLPEVDRQFKALDSKMRLRLEQREKLQSRLQNLLVAPRPSFLQTANERVLRDQLNRLQQQHKDDPGAAGRETRRRIRRLQGVLIWNIRTTYDERLTKAYRHLHQLDAGVARLKRIYRSFVRTRQAATQSYKGYDEQLRQLENRVRDASDRVKTLMARQGNVINVMAIHELEQRRSRLEEYQVQARFAMAESYDRASKKQEGADQ